MKIIEETIKVSSSQRNQMINITNQVASLIRQSPINDGDVIVYCPHTTAAITINENADPNVCHDMLLTMSESFPQHRKGYRHSEGNSDAHCKCSLFGCSEQILIKNKSLHLGTWQGIYFCEFDGPRNRNVFIQIRGE